MNTQAFADFGTQFLATLAGRLDELGRTLDTPPPDLTRDDGRELAQVVADAFTTGAGVLTVRPDSRGLARLDPLGVTLSLDNRYSARYRWGEIQAVLLAHGDELAGGQLADGVGQTVDKVLFPDDVDGTVTILLTDGRPFTVDAARMLRARRHPDNRRPPGV